MNSTRWTSIRRVRPLVADPDDELIAELALTCSCDFLVTHNVRDFDSLGVHGVAVATPKVFLSMLGGSP